MEALKYHLLPERRLAMQSSRTKPRKSTVGVLYAVGGMDCTKGNAVLQTAIEKVYFARRIQLMVMIFLVLSVPAEVLTRNTK